MDTSLAGVVGPAECRARDAEVSAVRTMRFAFAARLSAAGRDCDARRKQAAWLAGAHGAQAAAHWLRYERGWREAAEYVKRLAAWYGETFDRLELAVADGSAELSQLQEHLPSYDELLSKLAACEPAVPHAGRALAVFAGVNNVQLARHMFKEAPPPPLYKK